MKKNIFLSLAILCVTISSCTNDTSDNEKYLTVDYKTDLGFFKDVTVNTDNNVYALSVIPETDEEKLVLQKITPDGKPTRLFQTSSYFNDFPKITNDLNGKLYWTASIQGRINSFTDDYQPSTIYTMQGAEQLNIRMDAICSLTDDSFIVYDGNARRFKRCSKTLNTDFPIAGSDTYAVVDGVGANAGFVQINAMKTLNNMVYVLDSGRYIRKIDCNSTNYTVTTTNDLYYEIIQDFAIATNEDTYAIVKNKGICKLENGTYTVLKSGTEKIRASNNKEISTIDWNAFSKIYIKDNDLYLISGYGTLTKISNFQEKL